MQRSASTRTYLLQYIIANRTDTVSTVSSGKTETDQSNVYALEANAHVIISTTLGIVFLDL